MPERMVPIFSQSIYSALESLEARRLLSAGHHAHHGLAAEEDAGAIVMNINVSAGPVQQGLIVGASDGSSDVGGGGLLLGDDTNLVGDDGGSGTAKLNPGGQPHGHEFWARGPQPPVQVLPTPGDHDHGNGADAGGSESTDSGSGDLGTGTVTTPPPVDVTPPPVEVNPPHMKTDPPPADVTPPPVDVTPPPVDVTPPPVDVTPPPVDITPPPVDVNPPPTDATPPETTPPAAPPTSTPPTTDSSPPPVASNPPPSDHQSVPPAQSQSGSTDSGTQPQVHSGQEVSANPGSSNSTSSQESGGSQSHVDHRGSGSAAVASDDGSAQQSRRQGHDAGPAVSASAPVMTPPEPAVASSSRTDTNTFSEVKIETTGAGPVQVNQATDDSKSESALDRLMAMVFGESPYGHVRGAVSADAPMGDVSADDVKVEMLSNVLVDAGTAQLSASTISADAAPIAQQQADPELTLARPPQAQASFRTPVDEGGAFNPHNIMAAVLAGITFGAIHFHRWRKRRQEAAIASARKLASMLTFDPLAVWIDHPRRRR